LAGRTSLRWLAFWRTLGWFLVLAAVAASLSPASALPDVGVSDKLGHAATYAFLALWFCGVYPRRAAPVIALALLALGGGMEALQALTETRRPEGADLLANAAGIFVGVLAARAGLDNWCAMVEKFFGANHRRD
jgi:VanZ family protein